MDAVTVEQARWRGVDAWTLRGAKIEAVVTCTGAHLAAIRTPGDELNPLWQPPWPAAAPRSGTAHPEVYGEGPEASLLAAIVGHNLCIDRFGPPWPGERRPVHGEAGVVAWTCATAAGGESVDLHAELPEAALRVTRRFRMDAEEMTVTTIVAHDGGQPRDIEWAEHVTIGDPFLDGARFAASADGAWIWSGEPREQWRFPDADPDGPVSVDDALQMPGSGSDHAVGDIVTLRLREGFFSAERKDLGRRLEYRWDAGEFPWLCLWTQHRSRTGKPWNGVTRARGMEFSTKPFPEGKPPAERSAAFADRPVTCTVPPGSGLVRSFRVRWTTV